MVLKTKNIYNKSVWLNAELARKGLVLEEFPSTFHSTFEYAKDIYFHDDLLCLSTKGFKYFSIECDQVFITFLYNLKYADKII